VAAAACWLSLGFRPFLRFVRIVLTPPRNVLEVAAKANMLWSIGYFEKTSTDAVKVFEEAGTQVATLSDAELEKLQEMANEVLVTEACANHLYAKVAASQIEYMMDYGKWRGMQGDFALGRNLASYPDLEKIKSCANQ
jgi:hypothetical protein